MINKDRTFDELAAVVSEALKDAVITATPSDGAAVTIFSDNAYQNMVLDFVCIADRGAV